MPATSEKQKRLMDAAAHSKSFAKKAGVPQSVAKEYSEKSKGLKFKEGGQMKTEMKKVAKKAVKSHEDKMHKGAKKMATGGKTYAKGGMPMVTKGGKKVPAFAADGKGKMAKGGMTCGPAAKKMAKGGSVSKRADGVAKKGRTSCKVM